MGSGKFIVFADYDVDHVVKTDALRSESRWRVFAWEAEMGESGDWELDAERGAYMAVPGHWTFAQATEIGVSLRAELRSHGVDVVAGMYQSRTVPRERTSGHARFLQDLFHGAEWSRSPCRVEKWAMESVHDGNEPIEVGGFLPQEGRMLRDQDLAAR